MLAPPDLPHLFGSDVLGRDVLSRVIYGLRASLLVSISAVLGSLALAIPLGLAGRLFRTLGRQRHLARARPDPGLSGAAAGDHLHRHSRAGQRHRGHRHRGDLPADPCPRDADEHADRHRATTIVAGARARGASHLRVMAAHVAPNAIGPVVVQASVLSAFALQLEAGLSFLGLGTQPPTPSLGGMLAEGREVLIQAPWVEIFPGLAIVVGGAGLHLSRRGAAPDLRSAGGGRMSAVLSLVQCRRPLPLARRGAAIAGGRSRLARARIEARSSASSARAAAARARSPTRSWACCRPTPR